MDSGIFFQDNIFSNDLLRDKIFSFLPVSDLLNCSLISKKWLSHTRKFLHGHRPRMLKLVLKDTDKLAAALEKLENSSEMLFNGVYLDVDFWHHHRISYLSYWSVPPALLEEIKPILQDIFRQIPMKFVVTGRSDLMEWNSRKILRFYMDLLPVEQIKDLKVYDHVDELSNFTSEMSWQGRTFLELKKLDIGMRVTDSASLAKFLENFPVLREWSADVTPKGLACFVEVKKEYLVKSLSIGFGDGNTIELNLIPCMKKAQVFLRGIKIYHRFPQSEVVQLVWHLLRTSESSLREVEMNFHFFLSFTRSGIHPLKNVKRVEILYGQVHEFMGKKFLSHANTRRIFPNATSIEVIGEPQMSENLSFY